MSKPGKPGKLRRMGSGDGETSPALGSPGGGRVNAMLSGGGAAPAPASSTGRRNSVAASVFGDAPGDGAEGSPSEPARPLPECLDAQNIGKIVLMHAAPPRSTKAGAEPTTRSGKELWASLRLTLRDGTTRSWLGLTEKAEGADESLVDKTEKKARSEAVLAGMYLDDTKFRQTWDSAQIALLVYIAVLVPFRIGFDQNTDPGDFFFIFDVGVDIYFIVDVYLSFNTTRQDNEGKLVWKKRDVRIGYMKVRRSAWLTSTGSACAPGRQLTQPSACACACTEGLVHHRSTWLSAAALLATAARDRGRLRRHEVEQERPFAAPRALAQVAAASPHQPSAGAV